MTQITYQGKPVSVFARFKTRSAADAYMEEHRYKIWFPRMRIIKAGKSFWAIKDI